MLISHPQHAHPPTHRSVVTKPAPKTKRSSQLTLPSTSHGSGCCPAITSCENILHRSASSPLPLFSGKCLIRGLGSPVLCFTSRRQPPQLPLPLHPYSPSKYPLLILTLDDFFRNSLAVSHTPISIWNLGLFSYVLPQS